MRHLVWAAVLGVASLLAAASPARAQSIGANRNPYYGVGSIFGAPGYYGTAWGYPSFGWPRTYTVYSSPYGAGYGYGYNPTYTMPGYYGFRLWRPGFAVPGYFYGAGYYGTVATPAVAQTGGYVPPLGYYAPGFGAPAFIGW